MKRTTRKTSQLLLALRAIMFLAYMTNAQDSVARDMVILVKDFLVRGTKY